MTAEQLQTLFVQGVRLHQSGRLNDAESVYRQVLAGDSRHADSLHLLGVIAAQKGAHEDAAGLIGQAIEIQGAMPPYHSNLGNSLRALRRLDEAEASYRRALALNRNYPDAHNHLGTTLRDLGRLQEAEASYREAVRIKADYADAHNNLGNLLRETGRLSDAEASYRRALQLIPPGHPKSAQYLGNLGAVLRDLGRLPEAEASYLRALRLRVDDCDLHDHLGVVLRDMGLLAEADLAHKRELLLVPDRANGYNQRAAAARSLGRLAAAEDLAGRALQIDPAGAEGHNIFGILQFDLGRLGEAQSHLGQALAAAPGNAQFHYNLTATKKVRPGDPQISVVEALLEGCELRPIDEQTHLHFALAKIYDDIGDKDRGFAHLLTGNRLKRSQMRYDEAETAAQFARIKAEFAKPIPTKAPATGPIFILGMPRSGSTLVEQILASHPQIFGAGELNLLGQAVNKLGTGDLGRLAASYRRALQAEAPGFQRVTDKMLRNFLYCGLIATAMPDARILHTRRDPVDCCLSVFSKLFVGHHPYGYDLAELGRYYRFYEDLMAHWRQILPRGFMLEVTYEDVVEDLEGQARRILDHLELPWHDACLSFHQTDRPVRTASATQVRQPIYKSSVGRWRPAPELIAPLLEQLGMEPQ